MSASESPSSDSSSDFFPKLVPLEDNTPEPTQPTTPLELPENLGFSALHELFPLCASPERLTVMAYVWLRGYLNDPFFTEPASPDSARDAPDWDLLEPEDFAFFRNELQKFVAARKYRAAKYGNSVDLLAALDLHMCFGISRFLTTGDAASLSGDLFEVLQDLVDRFKREDTSFEAVRGFAMRNYQALLVALADPEGALLRNIALGAYDALMTHPGSSDALPGSFNVEFVRQINRVSDGVETVLKNPDLSEDSRMFLLYCCWQLNTVAELMMELTVHPERPQCRAAVLEIVEFLFVDLHFTLSNQKDFKFDYNVALITSFQLPVYFKAREELRESSIGNKYVNMHSSTLALGMLRNCGLTKLGLTEDSPLHASLFAKTLRRLTIIPAILSVPASDASLEQLATVKLILAGFQATLKIPGISHAPYHIVSSGIKEIDRFLSGHSHESLDVLVCAVVADSLTDIDIDAFRALRSRPNDASDEVESQPRENLPIPEPEDQPDCGPVQAPLVEPTGPTEAADQNAQQPEATEQPAVPRRQRKRLPSYLRETASFAAKKKPKYVRDEELRR